MNGKTQILRLATVNSDETSVAHPTRTIALVNPDTGRFLDGVTATVRLLEPGEYERLEEKHRQPKKTARGLEWEINVKALTIEILVEAIEAWTGIVGADGKRLPVCSAAIAGLDLLNKSHLSSVARTPAEAIDAEVVEASFREPAAVAGVAGG